MAIKKSVTIISWNCNGAFRNKFHELDKFNADVFVIQECENPILSKSTKYKNWAKNYFWIGDNNHRGLGVFANDDTILARLDWDDNDLKYFIPCTVNTDFNLLSVWCHNAHAPNYSYIGQLWQYLQAHSSRITNCIIAGDFNSNAIWDKPNRIWNHSEVVKELQLRNVASMYHSLNAVSHGEESESTFYLQKNKNKPYHIDYIFGSKHFLQQPTKLEIGKYEDWIKLSDHMPIVATIHYQSSL
jgi:exonuclease III